MTTTVEPAPAPQPTAAVPRRSAAACVLLLATLMDLLDSTVVNVALPSIGRSLRAGPATLQWVVSAYLIGFAATLITAGRAGDLLGRRRLFLLGVAGFTLASLGSAVAGSPGELITARVAQGVGAGALLPQVLASLQAMYSGKERSGVFGLYGALAGLSAAGGVLLGGGLTTADLWGLGWRAIFWVNVPVGVVVLLAAWFVVPETRRRSARSLDLPGVALLTAAMVAVTLPLVQGEQWGWPVWGWLCLAAGVLALGGLALAERGEHRSSAPLLQPALFRIRAFAAGVGVAGAFGLGMEAVFLMLTVWLQLGHGYSPLRAGVTSTAFAAGTFVAVGPAMALVTRLGNRVLIAGAALLVAGVVLLDVASEHAGHGLSPWQAVPGLAIAGAGLAGLVIPLLNVVLTAVPLETAGGASGIFQTAQLFGGAVGVAALGPMFFGGAHGFDTALRSASWLPIAAFAAAGLLCLALPRRGLAGDVNELVDAV